MVNIINIDFNNNRHCNALVDLLNHYMEDEMGDHPPHDKESGNRLIEGLKQHCNKICLLAEVDGEFIGLINCFIGFGTFAAKPFINIHDVIVKDTFRGKGIGREMLNKVSEIAKEMDCTKITLEVRVDNIGAQHLYKSLGYKEGNPPMRFWTKYL